MFSFGKKPSFIDERPIFDAEFCDREFKSHLFLSEEFTAWLKINKYHFNDEFEILERKFVQIEYFLYILEMNSFILAKRGGVIDYLMKNKENDLINIIQDIPSMQWRDLIRKAIVSGDLVCYDYLSRLPIKESESLKYTVGNIETKDKPDNLDPTLGQYPWGAHSTNLLNQLSQAATKFWSLYDPAEPSTAPTNEQVENWLIGQSVPKRIAEVMATILRADGLKTGRRK